MGDQRLSTLLSALSNARAVFAATQKEAARGISVRLNESVAILCECSGALSAIGWDAMAIEDLNDATATIRLLARELSGEEEEAKS